MVDRRPTMPELLEWLDELVEWQTFAHFLPKMERHFVAIIERNKSDVTNQKIALYNKWLSVCPEANWGHVIDALEKSKETNVVKKVKEKLKIIKVEEETGLKQL